MERLCLIAKQLSPPMTASYSTAKSVDLLKMKVFWAFSVSEVRATASKSGDVREGGSLFEDAREEEEEIIVFFESFVGISTEKEK